MSYPTIEDRIIDDGRISQWLTEQMIATRGVELKSAIDDVRRLGNILNKRMDRVIKENKTFKRCADLNAIDF